MKDLYSDESKTLMREIKESTNKWNVSCVHGLEELISLKHQYYQNLPTDFIRSLSTLQWHYYYYYYYFFFFCRNRKTHSWTSLVVQWIRINLSIQEAWIQSPAQEDSTSCEATKPMSHYWAQALESGGGSSWPLRAATHVPASCNQRGHRRGSLRITAESSARSQQLEEAHMQQ